MESSVCKGVTSNGETNLVILGEEPMNNERHISYCLLFLKLHFLTMLSYPVNGYEEKYKETFVKLCGCNMCHRNSKCKIAYILRV